jgi:hypothetical protein
MGEQKGTSIKLPSALVDEARIAAKRSRRSIAAQVAHWANLGRAFEATPGLTLDRIRAVLAGELDPGTLDDDAAALYDGLLDQRLSTPTDEALAFREHLQTKPGAVGYDANGRLVRRLPNGELEVLATDDGPTSSA